MSLWSFLKLRQLPCGNKSFMEFAFSPKSKNIFLLGKSLLSSKPSSHKMYSYFPSSFKAVLARLFVRNMARDLFFFLYYLASSCVVLCNKTATEGLFFCKKLVSSRVIGVLPAPPMRTLPMTHRLDFFKGHFWRRRVRLSTL